MHYSQSYLRKHMAIKTVIFLILTVMLTAFSQELVAAPVDSMSIAKKISVDSIATVPAADSLSVTKKTVAADSIDTGETTAKLNKRNYNHREQMIFGTAMMAFFAIILTTVQNMNPN